MFRGFSLLICFVTYPIILSAYDLSEVADPPGAKTVYVGDVIQNGIPLQMKQFNTQMPVSELLGFYKANWADPSKVEKNVPDYIEKKAGEWRVLSKIEGKFTVVVQVKEQQGGGSEGLVSVSNLSHPPEMNRLAEDFPRLGGTELISITESQDGGKNAATLILENEYSVDENDAYYRSSMTAEGWRLVRGDIREGSATMLFNKKGQQCEMAVTGASRGKSVIFANLLDAP